MLPAEYPMLARLRYGENVSRLHEMLQIEYEVMRAFLSWVYASSCVNSRVSMRPRRLHARVGVLGDLEVTGKLVCWINIQHLDSFYFWPRV